MMPGLSSNFSKAGDPLRGSKRPKSQFYGHYGPKSQYLVPHFRPIFFSSKYGQVGCPERCHVMPGPYATFSNARQPTKRLKTAKKSILRPLWTPNPNFLAILSHRLGPLGLKRLCTAQASHLLIIIWPKI